MDTPTVIWSNATPLLDGLRWRIAALDESGRYLLRVAHLNSQQDAASFGVILSAELIAAVPHSSEVVVVTSCIPLLSEELREKRATQKIYIANRLAAALGVRLSLRGDDGSNPATALTANSSLPLTVDGPGQTDPVSRVTVEAALGEAA